LPYRISPQVLEGTEARMMSIALHNTHDHEMRMSIVICDNFDSISAMPGIDASPAIELCNRLRIYITHCVKGDLNHGSILSSDKLVGD
jgi:hypothetical protein